MGIDAVAVTMVHAQAAETVKVREYLTDQPGSVMTAPFIGLEHQSPISGLPGLADEAQFIDGSGFDVRGGVDMQVADALQQCLWHVRPFGRRCVQHRGSRHEGGASGQPRAPDEVPACPCGHGISPCGRDGRMVTAFARQRASYWASVTGSSHCTTLPGSFSSQMDMWVMELFGAAPCQCLTPTGQMTTSPGRMI